MNIRARCALSLKEQQQIIKDDEEREKEKEKEKGCTEPIYGEKSKCILQIVPQDTKCETFTMDEKCIKKRLT